MGGAASKITGLQRDTPLRTWQVTGDLGSGTYGKVHAVRNRETRQEAAAKVAPIKEENMLYNFKTEIEILGQCKHENITEFIGAYYDAAEANLWIIIEKCAGGSISDILRQRKSGLPEAITRAITYQMLTGLSFLHSNLVIHRDLNASNTLLGAGGVVKIADFGVSAKLKSEGQKRASFIGSPHWMAPEVVKCENSQDDPYDTKCDIWSMGITVIELNDVNPPWHDLHPVKVVMKIVTSPPPTVKNPAAASPDLLQFLTAALVKDKVKRPTADQLLDHPFCRSQTTRAGIQSIMPKK